MSWFQNINVVSYNVSDWERAKQFYTSVLEWPVAYVGDSVGWMEWGKDNETHIAINRWDGPEPMPLNGGATVVFSVQDPHAVTAALRAKGVRCDDVVHIPGIIMYGTFYDPDGNRLQFAGTTN